ncbi:MAG TPA: hypothetical protein VHC63_13440 [Acidimicrobiales bacterium]|nr:hypothetical protein [Acidimicrobiales bacterium]
MAADNREQLRCLLRDAKFAAERNGDSTFDQQVSAILANPDVVLRALGGEALNPGWFNYTADQWFQDWTVPMKKGD